MTRFSPSRFFSTFALFLTLATPLAAQTAPDPTSQPLSAIFINKPQMSLEQVRVEATTQSTGTPAHKSSDQETLVYDGYFKAALATSKLALLSDDGTTVTIDGAVVVGNAGKNQGFQDFDSTFAPLSAKFEAGHIYHVNVKYTNTIHDIEGDVDGVSLWAYDGGGEIVAPPLTNQAPGMEFHPATEAATSFSAPNSSDPILVSAGEKITMGLNANDMDKKRPKGSGDGDWREIDGRDKWQINWSISGAARFNSVNGPAAIKTPLNSGNVYLYTSNEWIGDPITILATFVDNAPNPVALPNIGTQKDNGGSVSWTLLKRSNSSAPTTLWTVSGPAGVWTPNRANFVYQVGTAAPPAYNHHNINEEFGAPIAGFTWDDLTPAWKAAHSTIVEGDVSAAAKVLFGSGSNSSFVVDSNNQFDDGYGGFAEEQDKTVAAFTLDAAVMRGIVWTLPQTYTSGPNKLGSFSIERRYKAGAVDIRRSK